MTIQIPAFNAILLDVDGVIFSEGLSSRKIQLALQKLYEYEIQIAFVSNNVSRSRERILESLNNLVSNHTVNYFDPIDILQSVYNGNQETEKGQCFTIGTNALKERLNKLNYNLANTESDLNEVSSVIVSSSVDFDCNTIAYAIRAIRRGASFFVTGGERVFMWNNELWPGPGALGTLIESASGYKPIILGKPSTEIFHQAIATFNASSIPIVIGDDLYTDVEGGKKLGYPTILVRSGVTVSSDLLKSKIYPDHIIEDLTVLVAELVN